MSEEKKIDALLAGQVAPEKKTRAERREAEREFAKTRAASTAAKLAIHVDAHEANKCAAGAFAPVLV